MKKKMLKTVGAVTSAMTAVSAVASAEAAQPVVTVNEAAQTTEYQKVANVQGEFSFHQDAVTPTDQIFSLFGTVATGVCAKPNFAMNNDVDEADYYVNVSGTLKKEQHISLAQLKQQKSQTKKLVCSCATGESLAQAAVTGVPVSEILKLADLDKDANTITFKSDDGYGKKMPLSYVLDKEALIVYAINGEEVPTGVQVWMPGTVASYFTRRVAEIEVSHEDETPAVEQAKPDHRVKVTLANNLEDAVKVGDQIEFEGYADDFGEAISAIEFSLDDGETWTSCPTENANAEKWICWSFGYTAQEAGEYKMEIRARNAEGMTTPLAASVTFTVVE